MKDRYSNEGTVLLASLGLMVSLSILVSLFLLLSKSLLDIVSMQREADTAYWLAKSEAAVVVRELYVNDLTAGYFDKITPPPAAGKNGSILVKIEDTPRGGILKVSIQAAEGPAVHTISFQYSQVQKQIVYWTDSDERFQ